MINRLSIDLYFYRWRHFIEWYKYCNARSCLFWKTVSKIARRNICLAPHTKLGRDCFIKGESMREIDLIITDEEASKETIQQFEKQGKEILIASIDCI